MFYYTMNKGELTRIWDARIIFQTPNKASLVLDKKKRYWVANCFATGNRY